MDCHQVTMYSLLFAHFLISWTALSLPKDTFSQSVSSVAQSCLTLCDPMECNTPDLSVHQQLQEFTQTRVHRVGDASSHLILGCPLVLLPPIPPIIKVFSNESTLRMRRPKYWSFSFSIIPSKEIPGLIFRMDFWISSQSKGLSRVFSNTTVQKHNSSVLTLLYSPTLTSIHDYWKNHSLD